jgi:hypothetical protein
LLITNTSSAPLTWHISGDLTSFAVNPLGSTLAVGEAIDVSIVPKAGVRLAFSIASIDADIAPSQSISLNAVVNPTVTPPPDIDFGNVPIGRFDGPTIFLPLSAWGYFGPGPAMFSSNMSFSLSGNAPNTQPEGFGWIIRFNPQVLGPQESTMTFLTMGGMGVCPPNTFIARGVGIAP